SIEDYVVRQAEWSKKTFGPGSRDEGGSDHIRKELDAIARAKGHPAEVAKEWVDVVILSLDGLWRTLHHEMGLDIQTSAFFAEQMLNDKFYKNESRNWPDWRTAEPGKAIEHVRTQEELANKRMDDFSPAHEVRVMTNLQMEAKRAVEDYGIDWPWEKL